ncbi:hypothetical protein HDU99_003601, partial [Rhizoclosmatium hyalinum]
MSQVAKTDKYVSRSSVIHVDKGMALVFVHWGLVEETEEDGEDQESRVDEGRVKRRRRHGGDRVGSYDVLTAFKDTDWSIYEIDAYSVNAFTLCIESNHAHTIDLYLIYNATDQPRVLNNEEIFASDGQVEEYFAHDDIDDTTQEPHATFSPKRKRGCLPPVTPNASIRQDIMNHLFDDLWSEVIPHLQHLLKAFDADSESSTAPSPIPTRTAPATQKQQTKSGTTSTRKNTIHGVELTGFSNYFDEDSESGSEGESSAGTSSGYEDTEKLLRAMTIRSVPLQRRESSARVG